MSKTTSETPLIPYQNNAQTHSKEQINKLRSSIRGFGFVNPVIVKREYNVIAGHVGIAAAREESMPEAPCVFVDHLTEARRKRISYQITVWRWMRDRMKTFLVWWDLRFWRKYTMTWN